MDLDFGMSTVCLDIFLLYSANLANTFSNISQTFPSSLAANRISMSDHIFSCWWHFLHPLAFFSASFHDFCFSMFVHYSAFTYLAFDLISSMNLLATNFDQSEKELAHTKLAMQHAQALFNINQQQRHVEKPVS